MTLRFRPSWLLIALAATGFVACIQDDSSSGKRGSENVSEIDDYLSSLDYLPVEESKPKAEVPCNEHCPEASQDGDFYCTYRRFTETARYDKFVAFQPNSATLWPGSVISGADAQYGVLNPLGVELAPVTFSISLENINSAPTGYMEHPSLSAFREERNRILAADISGATPAAIDFEIYQVHSESQIAMSLGAGVDWPGAATVTGSFDFHASDKRTKVLVNYTQAYYTIDVDTPIHPSDFFTDSVTLANLEQQVSDDNPPLYIQSITYGRRVLFSIESNEDATKITAALEAAVTKAVSVDVEIAASYEKTLKASTIRAFVIGGSGSDATGVVSGFEGIVEYIKKGGNYSKESPGAPVAYKLAYLDNATAQLAFTSDYNERECIRNQAKLRVQLVGIDHIGGGDFGGGMEFYGNISLRYPTQDSSVSSCSKGGKVEDLWSMPDNSYLEMDKYSSWQPSSPTFFYVHHVPVAEDQKVCLFSHFMEEDGFAGDDDFGTGDLTLFAQDGWTGDHTIQVRGTGKQAIDVHVRIDVE